MSNIIDKLNDNVADLDGADFGINEGGTTISSFTYSYGSIEDLDLDMDAYVESVDGASTSDFVYLPKEIYEEVLEELEEKPLPHKLELLRTALVAVNDLVLQLIEDQDKRTND